MLSRVLRVSQYVCFTGIFALGDMCKFSEVCMIGELQRKFGLLAQYGETQRSHNVMSLATEAKSAC